MNNLTTQHPTPTVQIVEVVTAARVVEGGEWQYLVKWADYGLEDATWEPSDNLDDNNYRLLASFWKHVGLDDRDWPIGTVFEAKPSWIRKERQYFRINVAEPGRTYPSIPTEERLNNPLQDIVTQRQHSAPELVTDFVDERVNALLDTLNMENFDAVSDEIINWANKAENERDGFTLILVLRLLYEKALDASSPTIYAKLCRKMMENISDNVQYDGLRGRDGKPIAGGQLFRRYLLNRVQADFKCCWVLKGAGAAASRFQQSEQTGTAENDAMGGVEDPFSANYTSPETVGKRVLGLVRLMGELFKLQMITERIMHECLRQLIKDGGEPGLESICGLMRTVGQILDSKPMCPWMDVYFDNMKQLTLDPRIEPRVVRMLKDVIELRKRGWRPDHLLD